MNGATERAKPLDLVLVARHPYGGRPPLGDWQMARALARQHRVLYVEPPLVLKPSTLGAVRRLCRPTVQRVHDRLHVVQPIGLPRATRPATAVFTDKLVSGQVGSAIEQLFEAAPVVLTFDPLRGLLPSVERSLTVYWRRDRLADLVISPTARWLGQRDRELLAGADLVSCTASTLVRDARDHAGGTVQYLPNGCDADHFSEPAAAPATLPTGDVVIGFVGGAFWRLDRDLIDAVACRRPGWQLVLVGDRDAALPSYPNVHRLPYLPYEQIPSVLQHLDVGLIPYDMDIAFNHGSFPIKAFEYLAAGIPVVSTLLPALDGLDPFVRRASDTAGFLSAIEKALTNGPRGEACRELARQNTWDQRADELTVRIRARADALGRTLGPLREPT